MRFILKVATLLVFVAVVGCGQGVEFPVQGESPKGEFPFKKIAKDGDDPADNGPDDSTELDEMKGEAGVVKFPHAKHASNKGFGIDCVRCHHETKEGEDAGQSCSEKGCHAIPEEGSDPANGGPDDNLVLAGRADIVPVPFNHFTHTSSNGYKQACTSCHHTGENSACTDCHKTLPTIGPEGQVVPKLKRAFHEQCIGCHDALKQNQPDTKAPVECNQCHQIREFEIPGAPKDGLNRNRAFHVQCIGCHDAAKKAGAGEKAPTTNCEGCHVKADSAPQPTFAQLAGELLSAEPAQAEPEFVKDPKLEENKGPANMVIDHAKKAKSGSPFPHLDHHDYADDCYTCHHKGLQDPTCRSCHTTPADAKKAYHGNCIPCHKENDVPAKCENCHPK